MTNPDIVFESIRRGYNELEDATTSEIIDYFSDIEPESMVGNISNIKGIMFEHQITEQLQKNGFDAVMFEETNHPITDIAIMNDGQIAEEMQLKATDSVSYINSTLEEYPDVPIIATSEVAKNIDNPMVIDSGIDNSVLEQVVVDTLESEAIETGNQALTDLSTDEYVSEGFVDAIAETALPISPIGIVGALFGFPFL